ncbi:hypothetical protein SAMN05216167_1378 [Spirosoma endophyticum]|uniref:Uncharacterized protein n=1 Tax=Spirosoma endophyticum TaxID=662367 RepID=A0A1I2H1B5_9BACT|nr:hypothetical protein SAMN05216167_1378 [Spirosoma endophyticum]
MIQTIDLKDERIVGYRIDGDISIYDIRYTIYGR